MADAILVTTRLMCQVPRPAQLEPVFLLIQQQQTRKLRERVVKGRCQLRRRFRKPLKRHVQRYFFVPRIHKRLDLQRWSRQRARSRHILQFQERPGQQRRKHGAKVNWQDQGALRQKISQRARHPSAHRPLRAIAVAIRLRRVLVNRAIPRNAAEARECLAQNFFLQPRLLCGGNMLIVAPAALLEMRTAWLEERNFARDTLAPRRHSLGWPDSRARGGAVWLPQSRAMGGARRDAARAGIFFAGELPDPAN